MSENTASTGGTTTKMFVNLPVKDLQKATGFFGSLGFSFNSQLTDDRAACMVVNDQCYVMLLVEDFFATFTRKPLANASLVTEGIFSVSSDSREAVDSFVDRALSNGASAGADPVDEDFMYGRSFSDLDGHLWEAIWMDPRALQQPSPS